MNPPPDDRLDERDIIFLTFEEVCDIHDRWLAEFGFGESGFISEHSVRSAASQPQAGTQGGYFYDFPAGMAAAYIYYLANQQGFINGNKRAAIGSALEFLACNGYRVNAANREIYEMTLQYAGEDVPTESKVAVEQIQRWFESRLEPIE